LVASQDSQAVSQDSSRVVSLVDSHSSYKAVSLTD
jgi:hypothetical protein